MIPSSVFILHSQYPGCWWPGDTIIHSIGSCGIDLVFWEYSGFSTRRVTISLRISQTFTSIWTLWFCPQGVIFSRLPLESVHSLLTHCGRMTPYGHDGIKKFGHHCFNWWHQSIIWTNGDLLPTGPLGKNFSKIWIKIQQFRFKKMHLKMLSAKWQPSSSGISVFRQSTLSPWWANKIEPCSQNGLDCYTALDWWH